MSTLDFKNQKTKLAHFENNYHSATLPIQIFDLGPNLPSFSSDFIGDAGDEW